MMLQASPSSTSISVVSTAGGLASAITTAWGNLSTVTNLIVTGTIDARDFKTMRDDMPALTDIDLSGANVAAYDYDGANVLPYEAFTAKSNLVSIILPNTINTIGMETFKDCTSLTSFSIPNSVTYIGEWAFIDCTGLKTITIPSQVTSIDYGAFEGCTGLTSVTFSNPSTITERYAFAGCTGLTSLVIPISLHAEDFAGCTNLKSVELLTTDYIAVDVFLGCPSLNEILISSNKITIGSFSGVQFYNAENETVKVSAQTSEIINPFGLKCLGSWFDVDVANPSYTSQDGVFFNKSKSELIACPNSKKGTYEISSSVTKISSGAFTNCVSLTSITIPASVTSIGDTAFNYCYGLKKIYSYATTPQILPLTNGYYWKHVFVGVDTTRCILYVPKGSKAAYKAADQWRSFQIIEEFDPAASVNNASLSNIKASIQNGQLVLTGIEGNPTVTVYNMQGMSLCKQKVKEDNIVINLPAHGVYVVQVGAQSMKVVY